MKNKGTKQVCRKTNVANHIPLSLRCLYFLDGLGPPPHLTLPWFKISFCLEGLDGEAALKGTSPHLTFPFYCRSVHVLCV